MYPSSVYCLCVLAAVQVASVRADTATGLHIVGKVLRQYLKSQPDDLRITDGVHLVQVHSSDNEARSSLDDGTILGALEGYLLNHELRIRLPELMPGEGFGRAFKTAMDGIETNNTDESEGRGKGGKGGGGGIILLGLMMGKMMAALGIGGVGLLALKALMVSALALMLSAIIGLKKLVHSGHDEGGHTVIHASHGHGHEYRKKRELAAEMAYKAWQEYKSR